ncbi:hypothetical protein HPP92_020127 [Vanilla planifolia]|uniref:Uncharacterized protein n=1 Tax=Vanilla planifolia TaxID=51239 RepID=A0A835Q7U7_VANPL|nr:hypothetical protein HPP92_020127 [Vanilla planifolia]
MSAAEKLQLGQSYFLLPCHFFQSVLSFVEVASSLAGEGGRSLRHLGIHRTDMGKLQIRIVEALEVRGLGKEGERKRGNWLVCTTSALEKEYERMVGLEVAAMEAEAGWDRRVVGEEGPEGAGGGLGPGVC